MTRSLAVLAVLVIAALAAAEAAFGCSCAVRDARRMIADGDGAFVGTVTERREPANWTSSADPMTVVFRVERAIKGDLGETVEVRTAVSGASCGIEAQVGDRIGLVLRRSGGEWTGGLCDQVDPAELEAAASDLPEPDPDAGPIRVLAAGAAGDARIVALDARGRIAGYGLGGGQTVMLAPCPSGRRVVEHVFRPGGSARLVARALPSLAVTGRLPGPPRDTVALHCAAADRVVLVRAIYREGRVLPTGRLETAGGRVLAALPTTHVAFGGGAAYTAVGARLVRIDLRTSRRRTVATVPRGSAVIGARGSGVALAAPDRRLRLADARTGRVVRTAMRVRRDSEAIWAGERVVVLPSHGFEGRSRTAALGGRLFGLRYGSAALFTATSPDGVARELATLPSTALQVLVAVPTARSSARAAAASACASARRFGGPAL